MTSHFIGSRQRRSFVGMTRTGHHHSEYGTTNPNMHKHAYRPRLHAIPPCQALRMGDVSLKAGLHLTLPNVETTIAQRLRRSIDWIKPTRYAHPVYQEGVCRFEIV